MRIAKSHTLPYSRRLPPAPSSRLASMPARAGIPDELVEGAAVGTTRLARLLDRHVDAGVGVPELLRRQRAMQRQVARGHLDELLVKLGRQRHSGSRRRA